MSFRTEIAFFNNSICLAGFRHRRANHCHQIEFLSKIVCDRIRADHLNHIIVFVFEAGGKIVRTASIDVNRGQRTIRDFIGQIPIPITGTDAYI